VLVAPRGTFTGRPELTTVPALLARYEATFHAVMNQVPVRLVMKIAYEKWKAERGSVHLNRPTV